MTLLPPAIPHARRCNGCKDGDAFLFPFSMAFQPIVDTRTRSVFAYEALCRGPEGQPAISVLSKVDEKNRYAFDQRCRVEAIRLAARLKLAETGASLSINFMPRAVYSAAACLQLTLTTAQECGFPLDRLIFEITETEELNDREHLRSIIAEYRRQKFRVALDDFGAGYSGLIRLADLPTDIVKLDMALIRGIDKRPASGQIVQSLVSMAATLGIELIAEGVETQAEFNVLKNCGIHLFQGYLLARPAFEALPEVAALVNAV